VINMWIGKLAPLYRKGPRFVQLSINARLMNLYESWNSVHEIGGVDSEEKFDEKEGFPSTILPPVRFSFTVPDRPSIN